MRKTLIATMVISILSFGMIDSATTSELYNYDKLVTEEKLRKEAEELRIKKYHEDELNRFFTVIGFRESGNRYDITNTWGYMGKFQFGKSTLKGLGFEVTRKEFLNNPQLQEEAMMAEMEARRKRNMEMYSGYYDNPFEGYMAGAAPVSYTHLTLPTNREV